MRPMPPPLFDEVTIPALPVVVVVVFAIAVVVARFLA